jgi:hypothetical protein
MGDGRSTALAEEPKLLEGVWEREATAVRCLCEVRGAKTHRCPGEMMPGVSMASSEPELQLWLTRGPV